MLHGDPTNQSQPRSSQDNQHDQHAPTSASLWKTFTAYSRAIKGSSVTAYEDSEAKTIAKERRQARLWVQSAEKNSVVFEMQASISPVTFLQALSKQFPDAIGVVPVNQGAHHGAVVAFDSVEAQTKACSIGIQINNLTIIGTPTLSTNSSVFRISLERLPILRPDELTPLLRQTLSQYGKVLHVGLSLDPATKLFFWKRLRDD